MSEPTPLNAEELAWLSNSETFRDPDARWDTAWLRSALATIDAQAREIAALRGALERVKRDLDRPGKLGMHRYNGYIHANPCAACILRDFVAGQLPVRVLAGKEAQE